MELLTEDLRWAVIRLPHNLRKIMQDPEWVGKIFVGGGYLRSIVAGETINDVDVFTRDAVTAELLAYKLAEDKKDVFKTANAFTVKGKIPVQIIHRWVFEKPEDVALSFDFTICCAVISYNGVAEDIAKTPLWSSFCDERFYPDLAHKRLTYRSPQRNEDAGGSMLRVLKYYQKGYRIPLDSLGAVVARLLKSFDTDRTPLTDEVGVAKVITGLLREVDPQIDPLHLSHLPSAEQTKDFKFKVE